MDTVVLSPQVTPWYEIGLVVAVLIVVFGGTALALYAYVRSFSGNQ